MKKNFPLQFSAAPPARFQFPSPPKRRLLLGLTARHLRTAGADTRAAASASTWFDSRSPFGSSVLDRLQPTLTRYHE